MTRFKNIFSMKILFPLLVLSVLSLGASALYVREARTLTIISLSATVILLPLIWRSVVKPLRTTQAGIELLSAQESNDRLAIVGQPDADRIALLFNTLITRLHTERIRLREQESFLSKLIGVSPMGVVIMDFDRHVSLCNPAFRRMAGIEDDADITGLLLADIPSPLTKRLDAMPQDSTLTLRMPDNSVMRCSHLYFMENGFRRPFILTESLTEEVMMAERRAYGNVIRLMAHEVNNSMAGYMTLLDILQQYHDDDPDLSSVITSVRERCGAMGRFIGAYADVVRLPDPELSRIDLGRFISTQLPFLQSNSPFPLTSDICAADTPVDADADMLSQVLVNIIKNSSEAIRDSGGADGKIHLSVERSGHQEAILTVADNGCGISPSASANLFNPFFSTKPEGQGIGLTMTSEILHRHNARFSLRTDPDGLTRFRIYFKISHAPCPAI